MLKKIGKQTKAAFYKLTTGRIKFDPPGQILLDWVFLTVNSILVTVSV